MSGIKPQQFLPEC